jgi:cell fate regulator YaaT (PSP1 superfamily)
MDVILLKHREHGQVGYYNPLGNQYSFGQTLIVDVDKGRDYGSVLQGNHEVDSQILDSNLPTVLRAVNSFDVKKIQENEEREEQAFRFCKGEIRAKNLEMNLISVEYLFDRRRLKFLFTAWIKIDFRQLVRDLSSEFKVAVELRQIGVRDAAKVLGGIGICGRKVCCATHLNEFAPVNLKMGQVQNLSSNPEKLSGICGRLRCCLRYEYEQYMENQQADVLTSASHDVTG